MVAHPKQGALDYSVNPKYMPDGTKVKCSIGESLHKGNNGITFKAVGMSWRKPFDVLCMWVRKRGWGCSASRGLRARLE